MSTVENQIRIVSKGFVTPAKSTGKVLLQQLGDKWYIFWEQNGKIYCQFPMKLGPKDHE